jgi:hypothetical protein
MPMKNANSWIVIVAIVLTACGGAGAPDAPPTPGTAAVGVTSGGDNPEAAWTGTYAGTTTLSYGRFTWSLPVQVVVENPSPGVVRVPVREMCPSVDHVDFVPPEALLIALAEPGAFSFSLPTGEKVLLGSIHPVFAADGRTLTITFHGVVDGKDLEWNFIGTR